MQPKILWRSVLQATIDTLIGVSRGQYHITLANPDGLGDFLTGLTQGPRDSKGGFEVIVPVERAVGPPAVPSTTLHFVFNGSGAARPEWRIPSQRPATAYPLWRQGVGVHPSTTPGTDFIVVVRDRSGLFHARWVHPAELSALPPSLVGRMAGPATAGVEDLSDPEFDAVTTVLHLPAASTAAGEAEEESTEDKQGVYEVPGRSEPDDIGQDYKDEDESKTSATPAAPVIDPDKRDRGNQGHARTQNALAQFLRSNGLTPLSPASGDPNFDIAWVHNETFFVAEVKSLTPANEEGQLRLGLGQVLRYAHLLRRRGLTVQPVLAAEREPTEATWQTTCAENGVVLVYPGAFEQLPHG